MPRYFFEINIDNPTDGVTVLGCSLIPFDRFPLEMHRLNKWCAAGAHVQEEIERWLWIACSRRFCLLMTVYFVKLLVSKRNCSKDESQ